MKQPPSSCQALKIEKAIEKRKLFELLPAYSKSTNQWLKLINKFRQNISKYKH